MLREGAQRTMFYLVSAFWTHLPVLQDYNLLADLLISMQAAADGK
jgi:hypothetical protein